ncbi:hypothetical protein BDZ91DRAFT_839444 [Kalaharituber pfeilii]|nr:hypothetical protein BDZ91DRAFT_839444 [Kalaharituber pfeilii]
MDKMSSRPGSVCLNTTVWLLYIEFKQGIEGMGVIDWLHIYQRLERCQLRSESVQIFRSHSILRMAYTSRARESPGRNGRYDLTIFSRNRYGGIGETLKPVAIERSVENTPELLTGRASESICAVLSFAPAAGRFGPHDAACRCCQRKAAAYFRSEQTSLKMPDIPNAHSTPHHRPSTPLARKAPVAPQRRAHGYDIALPSMLVPQMLWYVQAQVPSGQARTSVNTTVS